jgi:hypothetical protein
MLPRGEIAVPVTAINRAAAALSTALDALDAPLNPEGIVCQPAFLDFKAKSGVLSRNSRVNLPSSHAGETKK